MAPFLKYGATEKKSGAICSDRKREGHHRVNCSDRSDGFSNRRTDSAENEKLLTIRFRRTRASLASIQRNMSTALNRSRMRSGVSVVVSLRLWSLKPRRRPTDEHWSTLEMTAATWHRNITSITSAKAFNTHHWRNWSSQCVASTSRFPGDCMPHRLRCALRKILPAIRYCPSYKL